MRNEDIEDEDVTANNDQIHGPHAKGYWEFHSEIKHSQKGKRKEAGREKELPGQTKTMEKAE